MPDRHPAEPLFVLPDPKPEAFTEARLLSMLRSRYSGRAGNGPRWAFVTHVRDAAGFNATRTIDAIAVDTWPSSGIALHGFEVKTSRGDWRRELAQPHKAAAFTSYLDYFWVVAPRYVVKPAELPDGWGLIEARGDRLGAVVQARRGVPEPITRSLVACLMRAACRPTAGAAL